MLSKQTSKAKEKGTVFNCCQAIAKASQNAKESAAVVSEKPPHSGGGSPDHAAESTAALNGPHGGSTHSNGHAPAFPPELKQGHSTASASFVQHCHASVQPEASPAASSDEGDHGRIHQENAASPAATGTERAEVGPSTAASGNAAETDADSKCSKAASKGGGGGAAPADDSQVPGAAQSASQYPEASVDGSDAGKTQTASQSEHGKQLRAIESRARGQFSEAAPAADQGAGPLGTPSAAIKPSDSSAGTVHAESYSAAPWFVMQAGYVQSGIWGKPSHWRDAEARARQGLPCMPTADGADHHRSSKKAGKTSLHKPCHSGKHVHFDGPEAGPSANSQEEAEVRKLAGQLEKNTTELGGARNELHQARAQLSQVEKERDDLAGQLAAWDKCASSLTGTQAKLESRINDLQRQLARQRQETNEAADSKPSSSPLAWMFGATTLASMAFAAYVFVRCSSSSPRSRL
ncbi:hypothetical protein WJX84_010468 [Apatococcus fuscideae]|uniref:Transmembrane protein n=1 Tax=Apatococcus fuscideae TaxID=2026836 RepID=A0AAW1RM98_9CHLO